jgi:hypothetical protein
MLCVPAMRFHRLASPLLALVALSVSACDPAADMAPPQTAQSAAANAEDGNYPPPAPADPSGAAPGDPNGMYASGEYTIGAEEDAYDDNDPAALTDFRTTLAPYGTWADDPTYGTVWQPSPGVVGADFVPYQTAGHWAYDDDYVWVSDYDWGWAPFHYGRWVLVDGRGWVWIPGRVYRGAWVGWGVDDGWGYVGWYPLAPSFLWFGGYPVAYGFYVGPRWTYCPRGEVFAPGLAGRVVAGPSVGAVGARVHPFSATGGAPGGGPPPAKLGYAASQVPHVNGAGATGISRAQQFARPSTAQALGARAPTRSSAFGAATAGGAGGVGGHAGVGGAMGSHVPGGAAVPAQRRRPGEGGSVAPHPSSRGFRGGGFRGGGSFGHSGGGGHGGGHR